MHEWKSEILQRLKGSRLAPAREAAIVDEWVQHLEDRFEELRHDGLSEHEARKTVLAEFNETDLLPLDLGPPAPHPPVQAGANKSGNWLVDLWHDLRYGLRAMRKNPAFTAVVVLTLGFGIGANTTVYTVVNALVLNPLPVERPSELVAVYETDKNRANVPVSYPNLEDIAQKNQSFTAVAGYTSILPLTFLSGSGTERVFAELVTGNYFETLGIRPALGRFFLPEESSTPDTHAVAVISNGAWQRRFGGASEILGRTVNLSNLTFTIVGVAPDGFRGVNAIFGPDFWIPAMMARAVEHRDVLNQRAGFDFHAAARLKPGVTSRQAQANLKAIGASLEKEYPEANLGRTLALGPLSEAALGDMKTSVLFGSTILMIIVGLVLLIACSNVSNLLLSRAAARKHEIAARLALGASRSRLMRQLLTESMLLGLIGGAVGLFLASQGGHLLWSALPSEFAKNLATLKVDTHVLVFALAVSLLTGLVFGIVPAARSSRTDIVEVLKEETRTAGRGRRGINFRNVLLSGQVALSLVSLATAALFLRAIEHAYMLDPGFDSRHLALIMTSPGQAGYDRTRSDQFYRDAAARVSGLAGIQSVTWASNLPFWNRATRSILIESREKRTTSDAIATIVNNVDLNYFATMGIPFRNGRDFTELDRDGSVPVAIVNETLASRYWPNQDPLGKRFKFSGDNFYRQVIGVVKTANYQSLGEDPQPCIYLPFRQNFSNAMVMYVRTAGRPESVLTGVQREIRAIDPLIFTDDTRTGGKLIDQVLFNSKMIVGLLAVFGILALGLACVGLYGIMAYSVNQRRREIGVRMALGAAQSNVMGLVLRQGMRLVAVGTAIGLALCFLIGSTLSATLYGVSATDPISLIGASMLLAIVAALACYLPARRASRVDPLTALRDA